MRKPEYLLLIGFLLMVLAASGCNRPIPGSRRASATSLPSTLEPLSLTRTSLSGQIMATLTAAGGSPVPLSQFTPTAIMQDQTAVPTTAPATPQPTETTPPSPSATQPAITASAAPEKPVSQSPRLIAAPPEFYQLRRGEFPWCLARRYNVNPRQLLRINGFYVGQIFYPGQAVFFPENPKPFPGERMLRYHPAAYTVRRGDTIFSISCYFGDVDPITLAEFNGLNPPYRLKAGQLLSIP